MLKRIINKLFYYNAYAVGIREVSNDSEGMDFRQNPFHMLMPTHNEWYADSFCFDDDGTYYLFMEIMGRNGGKGTLGVASYTPGKGFSSVTEILREDFHLSYPTVFKYGNDYYMLPETNEVKQIRLYKAVEFPYKWELHKVLLDDDRRYVDTSYYQLSESRYLLFSHDMTDRVNEEVDEGSVIKCFCLDMENMELTSVNWIRDAVDEINTLIFQHEKTHPESKGMGTTLVLAVYTKDYLLFGNVGDSSGFVLKDDELRKVTYDHTLVNLLVSAGELTKEEASSHPKKNVLMKALGAALNVDVDIFECDMNMNIREVLLCSDGLTNMLDKEQIEKVLLGEGSVEDKVEKLIRKANNRGGTDNISVAYLTLEEEGDK